MNIMQNLRAVYAKTLGKEITKAKQGNVSVIGLATGAAALVVVGIVIATGAVILTNYQSGMVVNGTAYNTTGSAIGALSNLSTQLPTIGLVLAAAAVIGILFSAFAFLLMGQMKQ